MPPRLFDNVEKGKGRIDSVRSLFHSVTGTTNLEFVTRHLEGTLGTKPRQCRVGKTESGIVKSISLVILVI